MEEEPKLYPGIMVSSTFTDLEAHRREIIDAINRFGFRPNVMEYSGARSDADVIEISLRMVRESVAYVCVIGHKYGQTPADPARNPDQLSITELEFNEARRLGRDILLFLMSDDHTVKPADVEQDAKKRKKLDAFRKQAKRVHAGAETHRVYQTFANKAEFATKAAIAIGLIAVQRASKSDLPDRAIRDAIARFIDVQPGAKQAELIAAVDRFETDYRALQEQVAAINLADNHVASLKADAEAALTAGDLDKARAAYRDASAIARGNAAEPARNAARLKAAEASAHLLALDWEGADTAWADAQAMLAPFDSKEEAKIAEEAGNRLRNHGMLFASPGALNAAIIRRRKLAEAAEIRGDRREAARLKNNLGSALKIQGERTSGPEGLRLLDEAAAAYRYALTIRTRNDMPAQWAMTQNNLGNVLQAQWVRNAGAAPLRVLEEAITAYRDALTVYTLDDTPAEWATTQNNLGVVLQIQGARTKGAEGLCLLEEALTAHRNALTVYNRDHRSAEWATTQGNLGVVLKFQGQRTSGVEGLSLLKGAVTAYRNALEVRTRNEMPADWATTQNNLGLAYEALAGVDAERAREYLTNAETAMLDALTVFTSDRMPYYCETATASLARIRAKLAALDSAPPAL